MVGLSDQFIERAQNSRLATVIPRDKIPGFLRLAASGKDTIVHLLSSTGEIIEITEEEAPTFLGQLKSARTYIQKVPPNTEDRYSVVSTSTTSSASSHQPSIFSAGSRYSFASSNTDTSLTLTASNSRYQKKPRSIPTSWARLKENKPFLCPTCGVQCKQSSDFRRHVENICETPKVIFSCNGCQMWSEDQSEVRKHRQLMHSGGVPTEGERSIDKVAHGCAFCASVHYNLPSYIKCMQDDQAKNRKPIPKPAFRLIALWRQNEETQSAIIAACERRELRYGSWTCCTWDDDVCDRFSNVLEYGCHGADDVYKNGVAYEDLPQLAEDLMCLARWESTNLPVDPSPPPPPPKDNAFRVQIPNTHVSQPISTHGVLDTNGPGLPHKTIPLVPPYYSVPPTMGYAERQMLSAFKEQQAAQVASRNTAPKRHPSLDSTILPESSARAKRSPALSNFVTHASSCDRPNAMIIPTDTPTVQSVTRFVPPTQYAVAGACRGLLQRPAPITSTIDCDSHNYDSVQHNTADLNGSLAQTSFFDDTDT